MNKKRNIIRDYFIFSIGFGVTIGIIFPFFASIFVDYKSDVLRYIFIGSCVGAGILVGMFSFFIGNMMIIKVVKQVSAELHNLATQGDLTKQLTLRSNDAIGDLVRYFNYFSNSLRKIVFNAKNSSQKVVTLGSLLETRSENSAATIEAMSAIVDSMEHHIIQQNTFVKKTSEAVEAIHSNIEDLFTQTDQQTKAVQQSSASIEQISGLIHSITEVIQTKKDAVDQLLNVTEQGVQKINDTNQMINRVHTHVDETSKMLDLIHAVLNKINVLSMNAAIQAAQAGIWGRGFAVVATEIRKLSTETESKAKEIEIHLTEMIETIHAVTEASNESGTFFNRIMSDVTQVSDAFYELSKNIAEINISQSEILSSVVQINDGSMHVKKHTNLIKKQSEDIHTSIKEVNAISDNSKNKIVELKQSYNVLNQNALQLFTIGIQNRVNSMNLDAQISQFKTGSETIDLEESKKTGYLWDARLQVGVNKIDAQHMQLFERYNDLVQAVLTFESKDKIRETMRFLRDYTKTHFQDEAQLMKKLEYPAMQKHLEQHTHFINELKTHSTVLETDQDISTRAFIHFQRFFTKWLIDHVMQFDRELAFYVNKSNGFPPHEFQNSTYGHPEYSSASSTRSTKMLPSNHTV